MKNPNWNREELILALDLYFKMDYGQMHASSPSIVQLSQDLKNLNIHTEIPDRIKFRSVNSVSLKLANLKKLDLNFKGTGMKDGGKLEKEIWIEFHKHRDTLKKEADLIRQLYLNQDLPTKSYSSDTIANNNDDFLFLYHRNIESNPLLYNLKIDKMMENTSSLTCEICKFDFVSFYGELGRNLIEIHCIKDSNIQQVPESNSLNDLILVCSNCHKVLDKHYRIMHFEDLKKIISKR